jgi:catechol 2,3-dioxygenase-like lactoylglutathione lyase family enzyme
VTWAGVIPEAMISPALNSLTSAQPELLVKAKERGAEVSASLESVGAITLFVEDPRLSQSFYEELFDLPVIWEDDDSAGFRFENTIVSLLRIPAACDLIDPGAVASREAGSRFQLTIWVDDADAVCAELATRGVELLNGPMNREWGMRRQTR